MRLDRLRRTVSIVQLRQSGFSLLELMAVLAILSVVLAVVMSGVTELQKKSSSETAKVDLTQQSRQFMDQIVRDLHHAGYPSVKMFENAVAVANPTLYGNGLISISTGSLQFEGDVDGTGTVSEVFVQLVPAGGPCPCTLQRGAVSKQDWLAGLGPAYYTQVDDVMTPNVFTAILNDGTSVALPCTKVAGCADGTPMENITAVGLTLNVRTPTRDLTDRSFATVMMSSEAKINNLITN
jgi:prepilin-type N-terminal cleavage/methylation domain-containing protein